MKRVIMTNINVRHMLLYVLLLMCVCVYYCVCDMYVCYIVMCIIM